MSFLMPTSFCGCLELAEGLVRYARAMIILTAFGLVRQLMFNRSVYMEDINVKVAIITGNVLFILANIFLYQGAKMKDRGFVMAYILMGFVLLAVPVIGFTFNLIYLDIFASILCFICIVIMVYGLLCAMSFYGILKQNSQSPNSPA